MKRSFARLSVTANTQSQAAVSSAAAHLIRLSKRCHLAPTIFRSTNEVADTLKSLLQIRVHLDTTTTDNKLAIASVQAAFVKLCRTDVAAMADVLQGGYSLIDPRLPHHGKALAMLAYSLPKADCDEALWEKVVKLCEAGLQGGTWHPQDLRSALHQISYWGAYSPTLVCAVESYVASRLRACGERDLAVLVQMLASFTELHKCPLFREIALRTVQLIDACSTYTLSTLVQCLTKVLYFSDVALADALAAQGLRFAEDCDVHGAAHMFVFLTGVAEESKGQWMDEDVFKCLTERLIDGEGLDVNTTMSLCKAIKHFPKKHRKALRDELHQLVLLVSREAHGILTTSGSDGGLSDEPNLDVLQAFISRYLRVVERSALDAEKQEEGKDKQQSLDSSNGAENEASETSDIATALSTIAKIINDRVEDIVSAESPPFGLIPNLLAAPHEETRLCALSIMREAALQNVNYPTLQTYRFLLALGDHKFSDKRVFRHLRNQFALTVKGIPMIQLCAALKCFVRGLNVEMSLRPIEEEEQKSESEAGSQASGWTTRGTVAVRSVSVEDLETLVDRELELEDLNTFLTQCHEIIGKGFSDGMDVRCVMTLTANMFQLGYRDVAFYAQAASYLETKVTLATPSIHSQRDARIVRKAFETFACGATNAADGAAANQGTVASGEPGAPHAASEANTTTTKLTRRTVVVSEQLQKFFSAVVSEGVDDSMMIPSEWMNEYDPANHITPLSDEQQRGWYILEQMHKTRSADTDQLLQLATEYMALLQQHRPDDLKAFFAMFEEKVFKNDKLLKQALDHLCDLGIATKFSGATIACILHSLAAIRFSFYATLKRFLLAVSEEQWSHLEASVLVQVVSGMAKLSLRIPGVLLQISERLAVVCKFLTPVDTALLINSLQSLGFHDDLVLGMLMQHAAKSAPRFDEVALTILFGSSTVHRLMTSAETSLPLLEKAAKTNLSATTKQKIVTSLKRCSLPRELIQSSIVRVAPELTAGDDKRLQLESS